MTHARVADLLEKEWGRVTNQVEITRQNFVSESTLASVKAQTGWNKGVGYVRSFLKKDN